jgi:hypothetical protein
MGCVPSPTKGEQAASVGGDEPVEGPIRRAEETPPPLDGAQPEEDKKKTGT